MSIYGFLIQCYCWSQRLYELGARRVLVTGTGPLGCVPAELAMRGTDGGCSAELQRAAALYNLQLVQMLQELNREIGETIFIGANTQQMHMDFVSDPQAYGIYIQGNMKSNYYSLLLLDKKLTIPCVSYECRICNIKDSMLRPRTIQWARPMHSVIEFVP